MKQQILYIEDVLEISHMCLEYFFYLQQKQTLANNSQVTLGSVCSGGWIAIVRWQMQFLIQGPSQVLFKFILCISHRFFNISCMIIWNDKQDHLIFGAVTVLTNFQK